MARSRGRRAVGLASGRDHRRGTGRPCARRQSRRAARRCAARHRRPARGEPGGCGRHGARRRPCHAADLHAAEAGLARNRAGPAGAHSPGQQLPLFHPGVGRDLHADGRRLGPPAQAGRPVVAPPVLADGGVLRRVHVLVFGTVRPARLAVLLGRHGGAARPGADAPALHAGVPGAGRPVGPHAARRPPPAAHLPARAGDGQRARDGRRAAGRQLPPARGRRRARPARAAVPGRLPARGAGGPRACPRAREVGHRSPPAAVDCLGHAARRRAVRARLRRAVRPGRRADGQDGSAGGAARAHSAGVRLGDRALPPHGRRGHRQARPGLRRGGGRDRGPVCGAAPRGGLDLRRRHREHHHRRARDDGGRAGGPAHQGRRAERARPGVLPRPLRLPPRAGGVRARPQHRPRSAPARRPPGHPHHGDARHRPHRADGGRRVGQCVPRHPRRRVRRRTAAAAPRLRRRRARAGGAPRGARRPGRPAPRRQRRDRVLARPGRALPDSLRVQADGHRRAGPRAQGAWRAAEQRGHGAAGGRGRPGGHRHRERAPLPAAQGPGRSGRAHAPVEREHPRVARQRPDRRRRRRPGDPLEPRARAPQRHSAAGRGRARPRRPARPVAARTPSRRPGWGARPARRSTACR